MAKPLEFLKEKYENRVFSSNCDDDFIITKYVNKYEVHIMFLNTGYETITYMVNVRNGNIRDKMKPRVYGVGIYDSDFTIHSTTTNYRVYSLWSGMLERCYCNKFKEKQPTYKYCTVDNNLHMFSNFSSLVENMEGFLEKDANGKYFNLDKDLLGSNGKHYGAETICFLPFEINAFLTQRDSLRGVYPLGVTLHKQNGKYKSSLNVDGKSKHIGLFVTPEEAFHAYKAVKEQHVKVLANKWKDKIDIRAYNALMNYKIEMTD